VTFAAWFNLLSANSSKVFTEMKRYLPNTLSLIFTFYFVFLAMFFGLQFGGNPANFEFNIQFVIVSNMFWFLALMAMQGIGWEITTEATRGTLEQLYMSPMGAWRILLARMVGSIAVNLVFMSVLLVLAMATARQWLNLDLITIVPILVPTLISMIGVGFMVAGLSILFKQIQAFLQILQFVFLGLVFVPLSVTPFLELAPFVRGVDMTRQVMVNNLSLTQIPPLDFGLLVVNAAVYFVLGLLVFRRCEAVAMQRGLLGHY
jgi:ABC-2 type transport system permease protein